MPICRQSNRIFLLFFFDIWKKAIQYRAMSILMGFPDGNGECWWHDTMNKNITLDGVFCQNMFEKSSELLAPDKHQEQNWTVEEKRKMLGGGGRRKQIGCLDFWQNRKRLQTLASWEIHHFKLLWKSSKVFTWPSHILKFSEVNINQ